MLKELDKVISKAAEILVRISDDPLTGVVRGAGMLLESPELLRTIALPSASEVGAKA